MEISVTDAKAQLTDLVRRAEAGDDVVLTRHGKPAVRLSPVSPNIGAAARRALFEEISRIPQTIVPGPSAARSQDFLYDDDGMPG